ncbi:hypothetical protein ACOCJ4_16440 [Knoellia sp. CPCC 206435]|uniref:hypothetical protein n=1 Tax=Knoellia terrae TaxID=3404797 RepID=UPI003B42BE2D
MSTVLERRPLYRRPGELRRRVIFFLLAFAAGAYGAAAAVSAALSDAETVRGKCFDALNVVPNLRQRFEHAKYLVDHREQFQDALDTAHDQAPDLEKLDMAARKSSETLDRIDTTTSEVTQAWDVVAGTKNPLESIPRAYNHVKRAWEVRPSVEAMQDLKDQVENSLSFVRQLDLQNPQVRAVYADVLRVMDNFSSDEIGGTLGVMGVALALGYVISTAFGFWGRRGRPGLIAGTLQRWGTRRFKGWYVKNLEYAMSPALYAVAKERIQRDIVANPRGVLDPEALQELERHFAGRLK